MEVNMSNAENELISQINSKNYQNLFFKKLCMLSEEYGLGKVHFDIEREYGFKEDIFSIDTPQDKTVDELGKIHNKLIDVLEDFAMENNCLEYLQSISILLNY